MLKAVDLCVKLLDCLDITAFTLFSLFPASQPAAGPHRSTSLLDSPRHAAYGLGGQHRLLVQPLCTVHHLIKREQQRQEHKSVDKAGILPLAALTHQSGRRSGFQMSTHVPLL